MLRKIRDSDRPFLAFSLDCRLPVSKLHTPWLCMFQYGLCHFVLITRAEAVYLLPGLEEDKLGNTLQKQQVRTLFSILGLGGAVIQSADDPQNLHVAILNFDACHQPVCDMLVEEYASQGLTLTLYFLQRSVTCPSSSSYTLCLRNTTGGLLGLPAVEA